MKKFSVIIPARYESTRLPGKVLKTIAGKPLIQYVYEAAIKSAPERVIIATDNEQVLSAAKEFGAEAYLTAETHRSGTDRISEIVEKLNLADDEIIVNLQGDEPLMPAENIKQVADSLEKSTQCGMSTLCEPIKSKLELNNKDIVKVVVNCKNEAMYFSRAPIAWSDSAELSHFRHIGIYGYRVAMLKEYVSWEASKIEQMERLEQLRALWHGTKIHVDIACKPTHPGVDNEEDFELMKKILS